MFLWTCCTSVRSERSFSGVWSVVHCGSVLNASPTEGVLQQYEERCDGRQVQVS